MREVCIDFSAYSSLRIGTPLQVSVIEKHTLEQDLFSLGFISDSNQTQATNLIGKANNLLVSPNAKNLALLSKEFVSIDLYEDYLEIGAFTSSSKIYGFCKQQNLGGLEFLCGLPGSLGGIIKMNAGLKGTDGKIYEIASVLESVNINGEWVDCKDIAFNYRYSGICGCITSAKVKKNKGFNMDLVSGFESIRAKHPKKPSCGSCFKNPQRDFAGRLLESVGLKGFCVGGVGFSENHANFLVNLGGGTFSQAIELINLAKRRVFEEFGIALECEVQIIE